MVFSRKIKIPKYADVVDLTLKATKRIVTSEENWKQFLNTASNTSTLGFRNQILIYAQRPNATVYDTYEEWFKRNGRVKKGTKGIAIITSIKEKRLQYLFDISDLAQVDHSRLDTTWKMQSNYLERVAERLSYQYDCDMDIDSIEIIKAVAMSIASETAEEIVERTIDDEFLKEKKKAELEETYATSLQYLIFKRCDFNSELESIKIPYLDNLKDFSILNAFGGRIRKHYNSICDEIKLEIEAINKEEKRKEKEQQTYANI